MPIIWWRVTRNLPKTFNYVLPDVGQWRKEEKRMLMVFFITALLWVTRKEPFGGWSVWFAMPSANDASIALLAAISLFLISDNKGGRLLDWQHAQQIPWGILILFGGGICIAKGFTATGLSTDIGEALSGVSNLPLIIAIALLCLCVTFLTEVTSNVATAVLLMPILGATAIAIDVEPALLMVPAIISCSCAFMLPVATPPNAIAFSSRLFSIEQMAKMGLLLNVIGVFIVSIMSYMMISLIL
jgi:sodium-dependent dicarboxylate transporter 2/3/5